MSNYIYKFANKIKHNVVPPINDVLLAFRTLKEIPGGLTLLSKAVSRVAPYFQTVNPVIQKLDADMCEAFIKKNKSVENHIGTVHVIAICNGLEFVMGVLTEASIPQHLRWLPKGMTVNYVAKADSDIKVVATIDEEWKVGDIQIKVNAYRADGQPVVQGYITLWITEKK